MASIEEAIVDQLNGYAALTALVGSRVYPGLLPAAATLPAVTYTRISGVRDQPINSGAPINVSVRFQFDCWAGTYLESISVSDQVQAAMLAIGNSVVPTGDVTIDIDFDSYDPEALRYRRVIDIIVMDLVGNR